MTQPSGADSAVDEVFGGGGGGGSTWRVPSGEWAGYTWSDLVAALKVGAITEQALRALIQQFPPAAGDIPLGASAIEADIKANAPTGKPSSSLDAAYPIIQGADGKYYITTSGGGTVGGPYPNASQATYARNNGTNQGNRFTPAEVPAGLGVEPSKATQQEIDRLKAAGFGPNMNASQIIQRATDQLASPNDAWRALQVFLGAQPQEATSWMQAQDSRFQPPQTPSAPAWAQVGQGWLGEMQAPAAAAQTTQQQAPVYTGDHADFYNTYGPAAQYAQQKYGFDPALILAVNASESNWGAAPGYMGFGIKGTGPAGTANLATHENYGGQNVNINDNFRQYGSPEEAVDGFVNFLTSNSRYATAWSNYQQTHDTAQLLRDINAAGYATDPGWADMIMGIANQTSQAIGQGAGAGGVPGQAALSQDQAQSGFGTQPNGQQTRKEQALQAFRDGKITEAQYNAQLAAIDAEQAQTDLVQARATLDAARADFKARGYDVYGGSDGSLRVEDPATGHVWTAGVGNYGQLVESSPYYSETVRARGIANSVSVQPLNPKSPAEQAALDNAVAQGAPPPTLMRSTSVGDLSPEAAAGYLLSGVGGSGDAGVASSVLAGTGENLDVPSLQAFLGTSLPGPGATLEGNAAMPADIAKLMPADWRGQVSKAVTQGATGLLQQQGNTLASDLNARGFDPSGSGGYQTTAQPGQVTNKFGQPVDEQGNVVDSTGSAEWNFAPDPELEARNDPYAQLKRILALGGVAFAHGGLIDMGSRAGVQRMSDGRPSLTLNEPATVIGDVTGKKYARIGETGKRETLMPSGGSLRIEPTNEDITLGREHMLGFATGGLISSVPQVVGTLPDGSLVVKSQYSGVTSTMSPQTFAALPQDQRDALEQQVLGLALKSGQAASQAQQLAEAAAAHQRQIQAANEAAQRQQLNVQQQILDAQLAEYSQGQTGADARASLAGLAAPLTQSQYLSSFVLPQVQITGNQGVLDVAKTPRNQPSLYTPLTTNTAGQYTSTRLNPSPSLNTRSLLSGGNSRPSLLRLAVR